MKQIHPNSSEGRYYNTQHAMKGLNNTKIQVFSWWCFISLQFLVYTIIEFERLVNTTSIVVDKSDWCVLSFWYY